MAPNQLLQRKAQHSQSRLQSQAKSQPLAQHQQPSAGRRSHRTLPKDQTQLLSLQHDHRHREKEQQRKREMPVASPHKLTANSGNAAAAAAASPRRSPVSQSSAVNPAPLSLLASSFLLHPTWSFCTFSSCSPVRISCTFFYLLSKCKHFIFATLWWFNQLWLCCFSCKCMMTDERLSVGGGGWGCMWFLASIHIIEAKPHKEHEHDPLVLFTEICWDSHMIVVIEKHLFLLLMLY